MAKYAGCRHIRFESYNPQSNSPANQGVQHISNLSVRHTHQLRAWLLTLPMITFALNTAVHSNTGRTPFFTLFGHHPVLIPELKDVDQRSSPTYLYQLRIRGLARLMATSGVGFWAILPPGCAKTRRATGQRRRTPFGARSFADWLHASEGPCKIHTGAMLDVQVTLIYVVYNYWYSKAFT
eukprot:3737029-Pleurochrysis_carterae.AAC.3